MKGIVLAGGAGTRLHPTTLAISKQLLPIYDKPLVYYPLSTLMLAGVRDILVITTPRDLPSFAQVLGNGSQFGLDISYAVQLEPKGLAEAFIIGANFIGNDNVALVLGDNIFYGHGFSGMLHDAVARQSPCTLFGQRVKDAARYGVAELDDSGRLVRIEEKPADPKSNIAITGLYMYDNAVTEYARELAPSARGELEITDLNMRYIDQGLAELVDLGRGFMWLDTGTFDAMIEASKLVQTLEQRQGLRIACLEEIALHLGYISAEDCIRLGESMPNSAYGQYVVRVGKNERR